MSISMGENSIFHERRPDTDKLISVPLGENSTQGIILAMRQERLETEIFLYAAEGLSHDVDVERQIRNSLVEFLDDAHLQRFPKTRYMRHVARIIGSAIREEIGVPWELVQAKASLRGTASNISDEDALLQEESFLIPVSGPQDMNHHKIHRHGTHGATGSKGIPKGILRVGPPEIPNNPNTAAGFCQLCIRTGVKCGWKSGQEACIPCHIKRRQCSGAALGRAQRHALQNRKDIGPEENRLTSKQCNPDKSLCNATDMGDKLDYIIHQLSELQTEFRQNRDRENDRWERIWPTLKSMSSSEVPVTESPTGFESVGQEMSPKVGTNAKRRPSNDLTIPEPKKLRFSSNSPQFQKF